MGSNILRTAEPLKCQIIDYFIAQSDNIIIGNEVMYGSQRKVVDLLMLKDKSLCAIEIKGDNDNLKLLPFQMEEYSKVFDYIYLFSTKKHEKAIMEMLPNNVGFFIIEDGIINRVKIPRKIQKHDKMEMLYSINTTFLVKNGIKFNENSDITRLSAKRKSLLWIHSILYEFWYSRLYAPFASYVKERGEVSHLDDLLLLNGRHIICH